MPFREPKMSADPRAPASFLPLTHLTYHILLAVVDGDLHGYGIIKEIEASTAGELEPETGTLYAAIKRMCDDGLIADGEPPSGSSPDARRRYYRLTDLGRDVLLAESQRMLRLLSVAQQKQVLSDLQPASAD
jgi:DNA-binding PadR family transcriptional regulator